MKSIDKYRGCLIGGAIGDALGYAVEFCQEDEILARYGEKGITEYELTDGKALISDDTQMTLFTANALLYSTARSRLCGVSEPYLSCIHACYQDWLKTQVPCFTPAVSPDCAWLGNLPEMNNDRAPGITCLTSLQNGVMGTIERPVNQSKGCGGVMRVAPIGLYFEEDRLSADEADMLGAEAAAITHGHELGYIPAAMLTHIVRLLAHSDSLSTAKAVQQARAAMIRLFGQRKHLPELIDLIDLAVELAADPDVSDPDAILRLGKGWVAEETLAIAVYCALRYEDDFEKAIIASVNHGGDSDSTGAVTGNILGARLGLQALPRKFLTHLELKETILEIADDLYADCPAPEPGRAADETWVRKYIDHTYPA